MSLLLIAVFNTAPRPMLTSAFTVRQKKKKIRKKLPQKSLTLHYLCVTVHGSTHTNTSTIFFCCLTLTFLITTLIFLSINNIFDDEDTL